MRIQKIQNINQQNFSQKPEQKREFIDVLVDGVKNPRDVQDCVEVPRGIFKAYIYLMAASSCGLIASALPQKWKGAKTVFNVLCGMLSTISAVYFAKPFAVEGLSPTVKKDIINKS